MKILQSSQQQQGQGQVQGRGVEGSGARFTVTQAPPLMVPCLIVPNAHNVVPPANGQPDLPVRTQTQWLHASGYLLAFLLLNGHYSNLCQGRHQGKKVASFIRILPELAKLGNLVFLSDVKNTF